MKLFGSDGGNVAMVFGLLLVPVLALIGGSIDMSRHRSAENQAQIALDAALLSVAHEHDTKTFGAVRRDIIKQFKEQQSGDKMIVTNASAWRDGQSLNASVEGYVETTLLGLVGVKQLNIKRESQIRFGEKSAEVALVLDVTGSMQGQKLTDLKAATVQLLDRFQEVNILSGDNDKYRASIVPFAAYVNVGENRRNAQWLDRQGKNAVSATNLGPNINRNALYDHLGFTWSGCVEARAYPLDIDATEPSSSNPETLFTLLFHPDEPDDTAQYPSTYVNDHMPTGDILADIANLQKYGIAPGDETRRLRWASVSTQTPYTYYSDQTSEKKPGPGFYCPSQPILPLTRNYTRLKTAVNALEAAGATNMTEGLAWGWRTLSNDEPFTQAAAYDPETIEKTLVLLTDGNNFLNVRHDALGSEYSAYGYLANGRLGLSAGATQGDILDELDRRTALVCENIKNAGITLYVIRLELDDARSEALLKACASSHEHYLDVPDSTKLDEAFKLLSRKITRLYISR